MNNLNFSPYANIIKYGTYYFPAWKHYDHTSVDVVCDRCLTHNLKMCIGYSDQDLCLKCVDDVINMNTTSVCKCELPIKTCHDLSPRPTFVHCDKSTIDIIDLCDEISFVNKDTDK